MSVLLCLGEFLEMNGGGRLVNLLLRLDLAHTSERSAKSLHRVHRQRVGELNSELNEQVSVLVRSLVERHSEAFSSQLRVILDDFSLLGLDSDTFAIQMLKRKACSGEGFKQSHSFLHVEISALPRELGMLFEHELDEQIACLSLGHFVSLSVKRDFLAVSHTLLQIDRHLFVILGHLLAHALFAALLGIDHFALTIAIFALSLRLGVHAGTELDHNSLNTSALAPVASAHSRGIGASDTVATGAESLALDVKLEFLALEHLLQSHFNLARYGLHLGLLLGTTTAATTSEHHVEEIALATATAASLETFLTVRVIDLSLFGVSKNFVSNCDFLELLGVSTLVGVLSPSLITESFLDLFLGRGLLDADQFVVFRVVDRLLLTALAGEATSAAHKLFYTLSVSISTHNNVTCHSYLNNDKFEAECLLNYLPPKGNPPPNIFFFQN